MPQDNDIIILSMGGSEPVSQPKSKPKRKPKVKVEPFDRIGRRKKDNIDKLLNQKLGTTIKPQFPSELSNEAYEFGFRDSLSEFNKERKDLGIWDSRPEMYIRSRKNFKTSKKALDDIRKKSNARFKRLASDHTTEYWRWIVK